MVIKLIKTTFYLEMNSFNVSVQWKAEALLGKWYRIALLYNLYSGTKLNFLYPIVGCDTLVARQGDLGHRG